MAEIEKWESAPPVLIEALEKADSYLGKNVKLPPKIAQVAMRLFEGKLPSGWLVESLPSEAKDIQNPSTRYQFEQAHNMARGLYSEVGLSVPTFEEFNAVGVDFGDLASKFEDIESVEGFRPQVVIAPCMPYRNLDGAGPSPDWESLFNFLANSSDSFYNPRLFDVDRISVQVAKPIRKEYPINYINASSVVQSYSNDIYIQERRLLSTRKHVNVSGRIWTASVVSAADAPQKTGKTHQEYVGSGNLLTVSQYLGAQATRIIAGETPMDVDGTKTWLYVDFEQTANRSRQGMCAWVDSDDTKINIGVTGFGEKSRKIGSRRVA
jgi:hypothetical protein